MARTHGHRTDSDCCRRTPCLHRLRTASVRLRTVSVRIGTASTTGFPLSNRSQYGLKWYANGLKRYANGASTTSVYSRLSPSYACAYRPFSLCVEVGCHTLFRCKCSMYVCLVFDFTATSMVSIKHAGRMLDFLFSCAD